MLASVSFNNFKCVPSKKLKLSMAKSDTDFLACSSNCIPDSSEHEQQQTSTSLEQPSTMKKHKRRFKKPKAFKAVQSMIRSLPIIAPAAHLTLQNSTRSRPTVMGTLFGFKKGKVSLSFQETTKSLPTLVLELPIQTYALHKEMGLGMVRVALECEKREDVDKRLLDEPRWTMFCNGKKIGLAVKREAKEEDLNVMEVLKVITMGIGVLPVADDEEDLDDEMSYVRASFEHVIGSKDSETFHMISPEGYNVPQISIFFVRS